MPGPPIGEAFGVRGRVSGKPRFDGLDPLPAKNAPPPQRLARGPKGAPTDLGLPAMVSAGWTPRLAHSVTVSLPTASCAVRTKLWANP